MYYQEALEIFLNHSGIILGQWYFNFHTRINYLGKFSCDTCKTVELRNNVKGTHYKLFREIFYGVNFLVISGPYKNCLIVKESRSNKVFDTEITVFVVGYYTMRSITTLVYVWLLRNHFVRNDFMSSVSYNDRETT